MKLKPKQTQAIHALLTTPTRDDAARKANVPVRTLTRWLAQSEFQQELKRLSDQMWRQMMLRLKSIADRAVNRLVEEMDAKEPMRARIAAANHLLEHATRLNQTIELTERLELLEKQLADLKGKQ